MPTRPCNNAAVRALSRGTPFARPQHRAPFVYSLVVIHRLQRCHCATCNSGMLRLRYAAALRAPRRLGRAAPAAAAAMQSDVSYAKRRTADGTCLNGASVPCAEGAWHFASARSVFCCSTRLQLGSLAHHVALHVIIVVDAVHVRLVTGRAARLSSSLLEKVAVVGAPQTAALLPPQQRGRIATSASM